MSKTGYTQLEVEQEPAQHDNSPEQTGAEQQWWQKLCRPCPLDWKLIALAASTVLIGVVVIAVLIVPTGGMAAKKRGAGLLLCSGNQVLLLLRNSKNNDYTWGLPGGNVESSDADLLATATREATEEMGSVPPFTLKGQVLTKRGAKGQKHYTVFIVELTPEDRAAFVPHLNNEHRDYQWMEITQAMQRNDMHPVVAALLHEPEHRPAVAAQFPSVPNPNAEDVGAGLLFYAAGQVFLVLRDSSQGNNTWAVPGGTVDKDDPDLLATATAMAAEELGPLPGFEVKGDILTRRGTHDQRLFTVFLCSVDSEVRQSWSPQLRPGHSAYQWADFDAATKIKNLHPVVVKLFGRGNRQQLKDAGVIGG